MGSERELPCGGNRLNHILSIPVLGSDTRKSPLSWFENQWTNRRALRNLDSAWEKCACAVHYWKWWRRQIATIQDPSQFLMTTLACQAPTLAPLPLVQLPTRVKAAVLRRVGSCGKQSWDLHLNGAYILKYKKEKLLLYSVTWLICYCTLNKIWTLYHGLCDLVLICLSNLIGYYSFSMWVFFWTRGLCNHRSPLPEMLSLKVFAWLASS